jgi:hypothetical protein
MKLLGNLLLAVSLAGGALAAATAYLVPLDLPESEIEGLTLAADAGRGDAGLLKKGQVLTPAAIAALRSDGMPYVLVREFSFARWPGKWGFLAAALGLLASAGLLRSASRRGVATAVASGAAELPEKALLAMRATVGGLVRDVPVLPADAERLGVIRDRIGELQRTHMPAFVEARPLLVARLGLGSYAELMDRYAAAERQLNRAWSAAADGALEESMTCLDLAAVLLDDAAARLAGKA